MVAAKSVAGRNTFRCVESTYSVPRSSPFQSAVEPGTKFVPVTTTTVLPLRMGTLAGDSDEIAGTGFEPEVGFVSTVRTKTTWSLVLKPPRFDEPLYTRNARPSDPQRVRFRKFPYAYGVGKITGAVVANVWVFPAQIAAWYPEPTDTWLTMYSRCVPRSG